ncbi:copper amine oxidase N-terminal domain-containing protein [Paenibacillus sp. ACRRX]|uniref:stalk domain-containing protein n=1 Tax=Paenibacillus sp. ACRRX TaxID=2918206 RepID=UPI001EF6EBF9|nr:stalk domain-containing protein [Paenibacillus sp. ACRRX]MCG7409049.1 copper amine oxidase N-terminal domain-containing protein [Paenibacillus sp. ACRRX]
MKKKKSVLAIVTMLSLTVAVGSLAYADSVVRKVTAYQNGEIQLRVNGDIINTGNTSPLVYNGNTYVPAIYLAKALGASTKWDGNAKEVVITGGNSQQTEDSATLPTKDNSDIDSTVKPDKNIDSSSKAVTSFPAYSASTSPDKMFKEHKGQAVHLFNLYGKALRTGDLSALKKFYFDNIKDHNIEYKINYAESDFKNAKELIEKLRSVHGQKVMDEFATDLDEKVKNWDLMDGAKGSQMDNNLYLEYSIFIQSKDFYDGVHFELKMYNHGGKWVLTGISLG